MYIIFALVLILLVALFVWYLFKRRWAIKKVKCMPDEEKLICINSMLEPFGFTFDCCQDIVISRNDAWQKNFGYMNIYDFKAPFFNMVFDAEPICFEYMDKQYRIEFWKGQYGITTGAEVGIYIRDKNTPLKASFYRAATDDEQLNISFNLTKKCNLFSLCDKSWWLSGFQVGLFSRPQDLVMTSCICFKDECMRDAFLEALAKAGYSCPNISICDNTVCFEYCCSNNYKLNKSHRIIKFIAQILNYINCQIYNFFTRFFNRTLDKITYLSLLSPRFCRFIIRLCRPKKKETKT